MPEALGFLGALLALAAMVWLEVDELRWRCHPRDACRDGRPCSAHRDWCSTRYAAMRPLRRLWWRTLYGGAWLTVCWWADYARDWVLDRPENHWQDPCETCEGGWRPMGDVCPDCDGSSVRWLGYRGTRTKRPMGTEPR